MVSASTNASVVVVFYNAGPHGFVNTYLGGPLSVSLTGTFLNGTQYSLEVPATSAVVETSSDGIWLEFKDAGFSFAGSRLTESEVTSSYVVHIDSPEIGVTGTITLLSVGRLQRFPHIRLGSFSRLAAKKKTDYPSARTCSLPRR